MPAERGGSVDRLRVVDRGRLIERASLLEHADVIEHATFRDPGRIVERARAIEAASISQHLGRTFEPDPVPEVSVWRGDGRWRAERRGPAERRRFEGSRRIRAGRRSSAGWLAGLLLSFAVPASTGALLAYTVLPAQLRAPGGQAAAELAKAAELPGQRPIVLREGDRLRNSGLERMVDAGGPRPAIPVSISIPAAGVRARVVPVRPVREGVGVPRVGRAGWFRAGARPGEPGRAVLVGHLDTRTGPGLFARLPGLSVGSKVVVEDARGERHRYEVVGRTRVRKSRFPSHAVYGRARRPVLVLVTCGGPWSPATGYRDNVIVYARASNMGARGRGRKDVMVPGHGRHGNDLARSRSAVTGHHRRRGARRGGRARAPRRPARGVLVRHLGGVPPSARVDR